MRNRIGRLMSAHGNPARLSFRLASAGDAILASRLVVAGWRDSYAGFLPASLLDGLDRNPHHDVEAWRARIADPAARTWIVTEGGGDIGLVRLDLDSSVPETRSELTTLYIAAERRGMGIGAAALRFATGEAKRLDALPIGICVLSGNAQGRRFYERHGARLIGEREVFEWDGLGFTEAMYVMEA